MKRNHLGFWTKERRVTVRLPEPLHAWIFETAIEERTSVADVIQEALFNDLWRKEAEKYTKAASQ
jgi:Arc/MetJ-type ribon-helix-helix transcriptional regulator